MACMCSSNTNNYTGKENSRKYIGAPVIGHIDTGGDMLYPSRISRGVAQPGSALGLGPRGREFESLHPDATARR